MGTVKTLSFKVTNPSTTNTLSWAFPNADLADAGFNITPEKVSRLPEETSAEFEVKLDTKGLALGPKEVEVPIEGMYRWLVVCLISPILICLFPPFLTTVKDGPTTIITVRANVCVPEVQLSEQVLEFGEVYTGWGKTMAFQLSNVSPINAEWEIRKPSSVSKADVSTVHNQIVGKRAFGIEFHALTS